MLHYAASTKQALGIAVYVHAVNSIWVICRTAKERERMLNILVVGGGPTGVEFAGELSDFINKDLKKLDNGRASEMKYDLLAAQRLALPFALFTMYVTDTVAVTVAAHLLHTALPTDMGIIQHKIKLPFSNELHASNAKFTGGGCGSYARYS